MSAKARDAQIRYMQVRQDEIEREALTVSTIALRPKLATRSRPPLSCSGVILIVMAIIFVVLFLGSAYFSGHLFGFF